MVADPHSPNRGPGGPSFAGGGAGGLLNLPTLPAPEPKTTAVQVHNAPGDRQSPEARRHPDRVHNALREGLHGYFERQRDAYTQARAQWRADHPLVPGSTWTPESVGRPPRAA